MRLKTKSIPIFKEAWSAYKVKNRIESIHPQKMNEFNLTFFWESTQFWCNKVKILTRLLIEQPYNLFPQLTSSIQTFFSFFLKESFKNDSFQTKNEKVCCFRAGVNPLIPKVSPFQTPLIFNSSKKKKTQRAFAGSNCHHHSSLSWWKYPILARDRKNILTKKNKKDD
jgi:hypothetical protein